MAGVSQTDWSWSTLFVDLDNDGWKDLFITNGIPHDITNNDFVAYRADELASNTNLKEVLAGLLDQISELPPVDKPNVAFRNNRNLTFSDESVAWGLGRRGFSNGAVYADLDLDGDLDLVVNNLNAPASVLENRSAQLSKNRALRLRLDGQGIGATVRVVAGGKAQFFEHRLQRGFESSQEDIVHAGLGTLSKADTVEVRWPSGRFQRLLNVATNQLLTVHEKDALAPTAAPPLPSGQRRPPPLLTDVTAGHKLAFTPPENELEEFNMEPLLPHRFSRQGPCLAVADVNSDGRDDFFVGGSAKNPGQLFTQTAVGTFQAAEMPDPGFEDTGALFFDANGDKYPDLYVVSGGAEYNAATAAYADRLYLNDGKGNFTRNKSALPPLYTSGFSVAAADFDRDGDQDLFVGGRFVPGQYPAAAESYLLANDGRGNFRDVTAQLCPALKRPGLVTAALWADASGDGWPDLLVTGEWMPLLLFTNQQGRALVSQPVAALNEIPGWWSSLAAGDFDGDGDLDFVAGNAGLNTRLKTPLHLYAADFDGNGTLEPILTHRLEGRDVPYLSRDLLAAQYPAIKKKFPQHAAYADAAIEDLFTREQLAQTLHLTATELRSMYLENLGKGQFKRSPLPFEAQVAPIHSMIVRDVNADGHPDLLAGGNWFDPDHTAGRFDAGGVSVLLGDGKGHFSVLSKPETGLHITSDVRTIRMIRVKGTDCVLVGSNSAPLILLSVRPKNR